MVALHRFALYQFIIVPLAILLLLVSLNSRAQISFLANYPDERKTSIRLNEITNAGYFSGDSAFVVNAAMQFLPFHSALERTVTWAPYTNSFARAIQDSTVTNRSIVVSSSALSSVSEQWLGSGNLKANASAASAGGLTFSLDQYCRFTLVGTLAESVSSTRTQNPNVVETSSVSSSMAQVVMALINLQANQSVMTRNPYIVSSDVDAQGPVSNSTSDSVSITGFLNSGTYRIFNDVYANVDTTNIYGGTASGQTSASTAFAFTVEPLGTKLVGFEITQTIQDWNNFVPLIAGKPTFVRAHIEPVSAPSVPIMNARLRGFDGFGQELAGSPLTPMNNSASVALPDAASPERRANFPGSVNFQLPSSWTSGYVGLNIELDGLVPGPAWPQLSAAFNTSPQLDLRFVKVSVVDGANVISVPPTSEAIQREVNRLAELYPIVRGAISTTELSMVIAGNAQLSAEEFLEKIKLKRLQEGQSAIYVVAASGTLSGDLAGISDNIPGNIVSAQIDQAGTLAHEVGHALGEFHPVNTQLFGTFMPIPPDPVFLPETIYAAGPTCGQFTLAAPLSRAVNYPFWFNNRYAVIGPGPEAGTNARVYGLANGSQPNAIRAINPDEVVDLMMGSYCGNNENWISTHTYGRLQAALQARTLANQQPPNPNPLLPYVVIRGLVDFDANTATYLPFIALSLSTPPAVSAGNTHLLKVYFRNGATEYLAQSIYFTPDTPKREGNASGPGKGFFSIPVAGMPADISRVEVIRNAGVVAVRIRTSNAPVIQLLSPNGGESLGSNPLLATWNASDADGDALTYQIQFSADGGQTWQTLAVDWPTNSFSLSGDSLPATTNAILRVTVSDGINMSFSQSAAPFTVLNKAPVVVIISPSAGYLFRGDVPLILEALVRDLEDGALPASSVTWTSSLDGLLGTGSRLETKALLLSEGNHITTVTALDSAGASSTATVQITVSRLFGTLSIVTQPTNQTVTTGQFAIFTIAASGWSVPTVQWQVSTDGGTNWSNLSNAGAYSGVDTSSLVVNTNSALSGNQYRTVVNNSTGTINSVAATLTVNPAPTTPGAPVIGTPVAGDRQVSIFFTAPTSNGGSPITTFVATCVNGGSSYVAARAASPISVTGLMNGITYTCSVTAANAIGDSAPSATVDVTPDAAAILTLVNVQSRKTHTGVGAFNIDIVAAPLPGDPVTVEPRAGGGHLIVFQFNNPVTVAGTVAVVDAVTMQSIPGATSAAMGNEVTVTFAAQTDNQRVMITIDDVNGIAAPMSASIGFLVGDVTNSRSVNAGDISATKARIGQPIGAANYRFDVNTSGSINAQDVSIVKARAGLLLP